VIRRLAVWLVGSALLAVVVFLVGCSVTEQLGPQPAAAHPQYAAGTACDAASCHDTYTHKQPYVGPCENCHSTDSWKRITYAHKDKTFDNGMHPLVGCSMCHTEGEKLPSGGCATCHQSKHGGWQQCKACHTAVAWNLRKPKPANHVSLKGGHAKLDCFDCHKNAEAPAKPRQRVNCHGTNHGGLTNCQDCHSPDRGWKPRPDFNHNAFFVRIGAHLRAACADCHPNGRFAGTPRVCVGCHGKAHGGLTDCGACHTPAGKNGFASPTFRHSSVFPLTGRHAKLDCSRCHPRKEFARVLGNGSHRCVSCHGPQHGGLTDCASCHTTRGFEFPTFNHNSVYKLTGKHLDAYQAGRCSGCHPGNRFAVVAGTDCIDCHKAGSTNPPGTPHGSSVSSKCQTCHTPSGFDFPHLIKPFENHPLPLGQKHTDRPCTLCHTSLVFSQPTRQCSQCHTAPHVGPTGCLSCHTPTTWPNVHFTHPAILGSFLIPNYVGVSHDYTEFGGYPTGCFQCHPGPNSNPDFTGFNCLTAGCHG
jgi:hypothetical protein